MNPDKAKKVVASIRERGFEIARALGLKVIAEGVETEKQRDILLGAGVHMAQGWLFAKPLPINELRMFIYASKTQLQATPSSLLSR